MEGEQEVAGGSDHVALLDRPPDEVVDGVQGQLVAGDGAGQTRHIPPSEFGEPLEKGAGRHEPLAQVQRRRLRVHLFLEGTKFWKK